MDDSARQVVFEVVDGLYRPHQRLTTARTGEARLLEVGKGDQPSFSEMRRDYP